MKNKSFYITLLTTITILLASCAGSRTGYGNQRKGYGCPTTASIQNQPIEKSKV